MNKDKAKICDNGQHTTSKLLDLLAEFQKIDNEFPLQYAICLVEIALNEGLSLSELSKKTGMPLSTVSRIVGALSQKRQKGVPYDLVKSNVSETEKRRKELYLTQRGKDVVSNITDIMGTEGSPDMDLENQDKRLA
jgi:DNA-binding MarR family transcriptional regulator